LEDVWIGAKSPLLTSRISGLPSKNRFEMARELMRAFCGVVVRNSSTSAANVLERCVAATACESATGAADGPSWRESAMAAADGPVGSPRAAMRAVPATQAMRDHQRHYPSWGDVHSSLHSLFRLSVSRMADARA